MTGAGSMKNLKKQLQETEKILGFQSSWRPKKSHTQHWELRLYTLHDRYLKAHDGLLAVWHHKKQNWIKIPNTIRIR